MLTEKTRNQALLAVFLLAAASAIISGTVFGAGLVQPLLFGAMAATGAILLTFILVALN